MRSRWLPSKANGFVTTAIVSAPACFAASATIGVAPVPVPPPKPCGEEHEIRALHRFRDFGTIFFRRLPAKIRIHAGTQTLRQTFSNI